MSTITVSIDLRHVARGLGIPLAQVQTVVELLDEGNTVPFITRYRKDQTGGLDEEQIRQIQGRLAKLRLLADRKQTILRSIEAQGKLTDDLTQQILGAGTTKRLEDLYLPFKPRKQTLATLARSRGLETLAREILAADPACLDLDARSRDFANPDKQVPSGADALFGAGHILAEQFSEMAELRQHLRDILQRTGKVVSTQVAPEPKPEKPSPPKKPRGEKPAAEPTEKPADESPPSIASADGDAAVVAAPPSVEPAAELAEIAEMAEPLPVVDEVFDAPPAAPAAEHQAEAPAAEEAQPAGDTPAEGAAAGAVPAEVVGEAETAVEPDVATQPAPAAEATAVPAETSAAMPAPTPPAPKVKSAASRKAKAEIKAAKKEAKKKKLDEKRMKAFRDYFNYTEQVRKIPPHRVLAINRGERARVLRVRVECELDAMYAAVDEAIVPKDHPHADYLRGCARDALQRLILPSLERELRRELTDKAETHAVEVFAKNLRNLLLQSPIHDRRILAIDPGFKSGCKLAALDEFGNMLEHGVIFLIGRPERREEAKKKVLEQIERHQLSVIVIGNGTACRETEDFVAEMLANELKDRGAAYVIVNEAGASVYSTSRTGREEFPDFDASLRGAISIGRRLQDPLSELVKIDPANIGVGLYQHDVKARHLEASLDEVVESCVNYVGVDVNTASPDLLRYVSGLNQLTARRVYEHRRERGPFRNRQQLHDVAGFGETTFVQAAGFLKIAGGDNPLDATWIHPESYPVAEKLLAKLGYSPADLGDKQKTAELAGRIAGLDRAATASELEVGQHTFNDIIAQLARPGRDPRDDLPKPVFKHGVLKLEDLSPGMELTGTVLNVVDFGAFVDIGMHDSGLVHVSHLADRFIRDPHEVVAVGDVVKVWVIEVDKQRRRVSLTMVQPGSERPRHPPRGETPEAARGEGGRPERRRPEGAPRGGGQREGRPPQSSGPPGQRPPRGDRPPRGKGAPPPRPRYDMPRPKPKPVPPITAEMKAGKEPLRTFSDLMQFYQFKHDPPEEPTAPPKPAPVTPKPKPERPVVPSSDATAHDGAAIEPAPDRLPAEAASSPPAAHDEPRVAADESAAAEITATNTPTDDQQQATS